MPLLSARARSRTRQPEIAAPEPPAAEPRRHGSPPMGASPAAPARTWRSPTTAPATAPVHVGSGCTACGMCIVTCPTAALRPSPRRPLVIEAACTGCWACVEVCPRDAIGTSPDRSPRAVGTEHQASEWLVEPAGGDRPTEPAGGDRPTEPAGRGRPAEPAGRGRPAEPAGRGRPTEPAGRGRPTEPGEEMCAPRPPARLGAR